jgi:predicted O-methyltransferase YrrM
MADFSEGPDGAPFHVVRTKERKKSRLERFLARDVAQAIVRISGAILNSRLSKLYLAYRPDSHIDFDAFPQFAELYAGFVHQSGSSNAGDLPRLYGFLLNIARVLKEEIPGDFAELGVYRGNTASILAHAARSTGRKLYLFDTFSGFDPADLGGTASAAFKDTSLEAVKAFVGAEGVEYVVGRFPDSMSQVTISARFAIVHLDADLEQPTAAALAFFYPRLSPGGLLILHDYSSGRWPGCTKAIDEFFKDKAERPVLMPDKSGTAIVVKA